MNQKLARLGGQNLNLNFAKGEQELRWGNRRLSRENVVISDAKALVLADKQQVVCWTEHSKTDKFDAGQRYYAVMRADGTLSDPIHASDVVRLMSGTFDPTTRTAKAAEDHSEPQQVLLQLKTQILPGYDIELKRLGVELGQYIPDNAYLALVPPDQMDALQALPFVRAVATSRVEDRCSEEIQQLLGLTQTPRKTSRKQDEETDANYYNIVPISPAQKEKLAQEITELGGKVNGASRGDSLLLTVEMTPDVLSQAVASDRLTWIETSKNPENDINNAREAGGIVEMEKIAGFTGKGLRGHVMEGINPAHPEFTKNEHREAPIAVLSGKSDGHGQCTFGEIFSAGKENPLARGIIPDAQGYYTHNEVLLNQPQLTTRYDLVKELIEKYHVMFQTASWGHPLTTSYEARSAEMDDLIFKLDIPITQSQSNAGTQASRPQAWGKNVISIGALKHRDTADFSDDFWGKGGSIGPARDGGIKPVFSGYFDAILTTDIKGYTPSFGGTSGATPMDAGLLATGLSLWTDGAFGNALPHPKGEDADSRFANRPHFTTVIALGVVGAHQWEFEGAAHDRTRVHQGFGFPDPGKLNRMKDKIFAVNQDVRLKATETQSYELEVTAGEPELKISMAYPEPPGAVGAAKRLVNDLNLKVTAPDGTVYWGNNGLLEHMYSTPGGQPNTVDNIENVFVKAPSAGKWKIEVTAAEVNLDGDLRTEDRDVTFSLAVLGVKRPS